MKIEHFSQLVFKKAKKKPHSTAIFYREDSLAKWVGISWREMAENVEKVARALAFCGVKAQDKIGICSQNKPQAMIVDFANFALRAVSTPMYATSSAQQIEFIVRDAAMEILFVGEQFQYENAVAALRAGAPLKRIVVFDDSVDLRGVEQAVYFKDFLEFDKENKYSALVNQRKNEATPTDLAILMYTSGTTGEPKGVMLTHENLLEAMRIHSIRMTNLRRGERSLAFLPLSHIFERGWSYYCLLKNVKIYLNKNPQEIQRAVREVRPHYMCAVPRFWEKVAIGVQERISQFSPAKQGLVTWAMSVGKKYNVDCLRLRKKPGLLLWLRYRIADKLVFSILKKTLGISFGKMFPTAGASMDGKLIAFFRNMGIPICYGYGLTETFATVSCFEESGYDFASVGTVMPDVQVKISDDDEILVKAKTVSPGYFNRPKETAESFIDGWFRTGDMGKLDENGNLILVDRIKDLFKTSNGKYIAPQQIETRLAADKFIEQIAVIGNNRNYVTAIIAPAIEPLKAFAAENGIAFERLDELFAAEQVQQLFTWRIEQAQVDMASFEKIKKFRLIKRGFTMESGELTSTLKLRRAVILQHYKSLIDEMYDPQDVRIL